MGNKWYAGFTVVELLVVVVVLGILISIGTFSYMNIVRDTRDTERRTEAETYALALGSWARDNDRSPVLTNAGHNNTGEGWLMSSASGYTTNIETVLLNEEYLKEAIVAPPPLPANSNGYAFFACNKSNPSEGRYGVFAILENPRTEDTAQATQWANECNPAPLNAPYNANYVHVFQFRQ